MLHRVTPKAVAYRNEAGDFLQEFQRAVNGHHQRLVRTGGSDDFEERFLGGDTLCLLEEGEGNSVYVVNDFFSTLPSFVFVKSQDVIHFDDNLS